ncbi:MAG: 23S rRNA (pseudouridine(1915)-N(3))-methyltransferase RlmH [Pseudomonadota bacterium]
MQIHLITVGNRITSWVQQGYEGYAKRMHRECELILREIAPGKRFKHSDVPRLVNEEGRRMLAAIPKDSHVVALDPAGRQWSTRELSDALDGWQQKGAAVSLLVGGPEGLSDACRSRADQAWSLSKLTFPHPLVRVIVAEQLYRSWSLLRNHPYHR